MAQLKRLEAKRAIYINRITEIYTLALKAMNDSSLIQQFTVRFEDIEQVYDTFQKIHNDIIGLLSEDSEFEVQEKIRQDTDKFYYDSKFINNSICKPSISSHSQPSCVKVEPNVKLPKITIPIFKGDQQLWPTFYDLFKKLIHENEELSNVEKHQYLLSYLEEEPLKLLSGITITNDNYDIAFDKLVSRYQNKRLLAANALNAILSATLKSINAKDLRSLLNTFSESLAMLNALQFQTDHWDFILFHLLLVKLDIETRTNFEIKFSNVQIPRYSNLFEFLENKCKALESVQHLTTNIKANKSAFSNLNLSGQSKAQNKSPSFAFHQKVHYHSTHSTVKCYLCGQPHTLSKCTKFLEKSPNDRLTYVKQAKLCLNCLHHSHTVQSCKSAFSCRICHHRHHSVLHITKNSFTSSSEFQNNSEGISNRGTFDDTLNTAPSSSSTTVANIFSVHSTVLLGTAVVDIFDGKGNCQPIRILIDSGSQSNFISERCIRRLGLPRRSFSSSIFGLNEMTSVSTKGLTHCTGWANKRGKRLYLRN